MIIMGIDPGVGTIGFGIIEAEKLQCRLIRYGVITTPPNTPLSQRLVQIHRDMTELLQLFKPDEVAIEELFFSKNITTGISVAHGRGVILLAIAEQCIPVYEYTPNQVKQAITGYGSAEKGQMMRMTQRLLKMDTIPRPDDAADALAMAICHSRTATSLLNQERRFVPKQYTTK